MTTVTLLARLPEYGLDSGANKEKVDVARSTREGCSGGAWRSAKRPPYGGG